MPIVSAFMAECASSGVSLSTRADNVSQHLQVICAWPVSGQYGPGSRTLYYALIAACLLAQKVEWLVSACLPAALLFPAVAAIHAIILAALHVDEAVDMDIFGSFQFCAMGIVAAPATVMLSKRYLKTQGRNIIFLWATLLLIGLLCLAVEFYRIKTKCCIPSDVTGRPGPNNFPYNSDNPVCPIQCSTNDPGSPDSPLRRGSSNEIYIIPAPSVLTFGTATFVASGCCVHAILCLAFMWKNMVHFRNKEVLVNDGEDGPRSKVISGTNNATLEMMDNVNNQIHAFLVVAAGFIFGGAGIALLILGEINFFSPQVNFQTEPMASIGQWAPLSGTGMALIGSLYVILARDVELEMKKHTDDDDHHLGQHPEFEIIAETATATHHENTPISGNRQLRPSPVPIQSNEDRGNTPSSSAKTLDAGSRDAGYRKKVARRLIKVSKMMGQLPSEDIEQMEVDHEHADNYPTIPGEEIRNPDLPHTSQAYSFRREEDERLSRSPSRSYIGSNGPDSGGVDSSVAIRPSSPTRRQLRQVRAATVPAARSSSNLRPPVIHQSHDGTRPVRSDLLDIPSPSRGSPTRDSSCDSSRSGVYMSGAHDPMSSRISRSSSQRDSYPSVRRTPSSDEAIALSRIARSPAASHLPDPTAPHHEPPLPP